MNHRNNVKLSKVDLWFQKAFAAHNAGKIEEAEALYRRVLQKTPVDMEALYLLGTACSQLGRYDEATKYLKQALDIQPDHPEALNNFGLTLKALRKNEEALAYYKRALVLKPDYVDALNNLGNVLEVLGELDEAERHLRRVLQLNQNMADAHCNLGMVLKGKDRFEEAAQCFLRGIELKSDQVISYDNLGQIYKVWGRFEAALAAFDRATALNPEAASPHNNRGAVLEEMGRFDEALAEYERAAVLNPDDVTPRWNQAFLYLRQGVLDRGWEAHELRLNMQVANRFPYPQWDGSALEAKTILIFAEQGLGDEILFASCILDMISRAGHCVIECEPRLAPLFSRSFPSATVVGAPRLEIGWLLNVPKIDVQSPAGSLPRYLRPTLESFPDRPAYLVADPERVEYWRSRLALLGPGLKVGICWRSSLSRGERRRMYSELTQWGEIFKVPSVHFVNLQYDECVEELQEVENAFGVKVTVFPEIDLRNEIDEAAALAKAVDLVISAGTAVAEIAAGLGVETWRIDEYAKSWIALGTDRMPWHPTLTSFRQSSHDDWDTPLALIGQMLKDKVLGNSNATAYLQLPFGAEIAVDGSPDDPSTYILREQGAWFDPEYEFVLGLAYPEMRMVDVGSGVGAYATPLAKRIGGGRLWAITHTAAETNLLMKSRMRNRLETCITVAIADSDFSLDSEMDKHGLDNIAFVRVATDAVKADFLAGAARFLTSNSPLLMFGIKPGKDFNFSLTRGLNAHSYGLYRLVPGLGLLVPFASSIEELDVYALNLFACKPDRADALARQGHLIRQFHGLDNYPGIDLTYWQDYLRTIPYAAGMLDGWLNARQKMKDWEVYWMALNLFAMTKSERLSAAERYTCLQTAASVLSTLLQEQANLPRLLSLCRILIDLGKREAAVSLLNQICAQLESGMPRSLDEPCLALTERFALISPIDREAEWSVAMILEQREYLRAFSSFFTGQESLPVLEEVRALGFGGEEIERRILLIKTRFGIS